MMDCGSCMRFIGRVWIITGRGYNLKTINKLAKTFKDLTTENIEYLKHVYYLDITHKEKTDILSSKFGRSERTIRLWWKNLNLSRLYSDLPPQLQKAQERIIDKDTQVVLVTTAQNKTSVNKDFLNNLVAYQSYLTDTLGKKCQIVIASARYRNPTNNIEDEKTKAADWWADEVNDYLYYGRVSFGDSTILADARISPTASEPLNGYELLSDNGHLILGHSRIHFKTLARLRGEPLRTMSTTGYITSKNYSNSRAGAVSFEHHAYGFSIIELKDKDSCYIPRNVKVKSDGSFIDLVYSVSQEKVEIIDSSLGLILGDLHCREINKPLLDLTLKLSEKYFKPNITVLHDVADFSTANPHETKDMFIQRLKISKNKHLIEDEINECLDIVEEIKGCCNKVIVVESNHDIFFQRHVDSANWKNDLHNSPTYLKYAYIQQTVDLREFGNIFGYILYEKFKGAVEYIKMGDSFKIGEYECGMHHDWGVNGSKGSVKGLSRLNRKSVGGHTHSPVLYNNITSVGVTANLSQYYNRKGLSSWAHAHSVVHHNGKNQLLVFGDDLSLSGLI